MSCSAASVSSVWAGDTSSPYTGLTFTYQLFSSSSSVNSIDRLTLNRFAGFQTDVGYNGSGIVPSRASRTATGELMAFVFENAFFQPTLTPGSSSPLLVIQTDSPVWAIGNASIIDGATANVPAFVPQAVPEPATLGLVVIGLATLATRKKF
ncbi:MAG: PEP-CTERM sorting domain-containing protein [Verrucomicrobiota bacterium]